MFGLFCCYLYFIFYRLVSGKPLRYLQNSIDLREQTMKALVEYLQPNYLAELSSETVELIPLVPEHRDALVKAASDGELWKLWFTSVPNEEKVDAYLAMAFETKANGTSLPFAVVEKATGNIIGTTRLCNADVKNRRVEIGYTWYSKSFQRTSVNTECKLLMLGLAFDRMEAIAVEFRTHWFNHKSRAAIARLGAKQDGVLRNHQISPDGSIRDTVVFSILNTEWPLVKKSLNHKLDAYK